MIGSQSRRVIRNCSMNYFAACAANSNDLAAAEAREAGAPAESVRTAPGGVEFEGSLECAYRFALWSRTASRLLLLIGTAEGVESGDQLHHRAMAVPWFEHLTPDTRFAVYATVRNSRWLRDGRYAALKVKDAIADQMREIHDARPSVDTENPDLRVHVHVDGIYVYFYIDLTGESLHRRGYRKSGSAVTMKEHTAAVLLLRSGWMKAAEEGKVLLDPFCGSGTIPIEAALMAGDTAPGLLHQESYACIRWKGHDPELWKRLLDEARARSQAAAASIPPIFAWDSDPKAVQSTLSHAQNAGVQEHISCAVRDFTTVSREEIPSPPGLLVTDPPYGVRLESSKLEQLYRAAGKTLSTRFGGWQVTVICGDEQLLQELHLKPHTSNTLYNGGIKCTAARYEIFTEERREEFTRRAEERLREREEAELSLGAEMFANRLKKNRRMLKAYLKRSGTSSYRLYDADMPEYSAAVDIYEERWVHLQEYAPPATVDPEAAQRRLQEMVDAVNRVTGISYDSIYVKQRRRQRGKEQYNRRTSAADRPDSFFIMHEHGLRFYVNFTDYLDTGIFLDHRNVRKLIMDSSSSKRFLNLFGYTAAASVHAAAGGALSTTTVDASKTYISWGEKNMELNGYSGMEHQFHRADCVQWLESNRLKFDLILLDPPTFSNSKSRPDVFDIQRDHPELIMAAMRHLEKGGMLIFSNNYKDFSLSPVLTGRYDVQEITASTVPEDFAGSKRIHRCWTVKLREKKHQEAPQKPPRTTAVRRKPHKSTPPPPAVKRVVRSVPKPEKKENG
jgi:23S rRNA (guanine2445-N2)-methyltransferase / 23S rRNA (guanine2069-N7)-methyltransferase